MAGDAHLRIGELSRRSGVSVELLRAWERRYGLLRPQRSAGGLRLYSSVDVERVRAMQRHMTQGLAAREAAALVSQAPAEAAPARTGAPPFDPPRARAELGDALEAFDEPRAQAVFDALLAVATLDALLSDVVMPYLHDLGDRWERGELSIAQEHFASNVLRGRLLGLARGWGRGEGPRALLACPEGERHDLALIAFGLALRERGWRIDYLGPDTPVESLEEAARRTDPSVVVLSAVRREPLEQLVGLATRHRVAIAGPGAAGARVQGVERLTTDPVTAAERLAT
ncbi:MerR family transcriptional regulator [Rhizobium sp.]|uniref:MerR family transcriptional regulator n=1 Tax=Rhizobium sp. TaxID=391 RepID=UPI00389A60CB